MVIYVPLYLYTIVHFDWKEIGIIFTVMLLPFIIFETPLGRMFDRIHNEKDTLMVGFMIIGISTILMFYLNMPSLLLWSVLLFISRIGASFVEVGSEYSFFKRVSDRDAGFISIYRMAIPIAYIFVPLLLGPLANALTVRSVFLIVGIAMFIGSTVSYKLRSIKNPA
jgi:MFS family permease